MNPSTVNRTPDDSWLARRIAECHGPDWAGNAAEALDMALVARAHGVAEIDIVEAFGTEAGRLTGVAAALAGRAPGAVFERRPFVAALEGRLVEAFDRRTMATKAPQPPARRRLGLLANVPGRPELAVAAAVAVFLGVSALSDGWSASPAMAATPTNTVRETGTPLGPTGTATSESPAAWATAQPLALAAAGSFPADGPIEW